MYPANLPEVCPRCGESVPRAAAGRCPACLTPFLPAGGLPATPAPAAPGPDRSGAARG